MGFAALALAPGLALGSFLNVVAARVPERRSLVRPRSACPGCGHEIAWYDNVPIVSYLVLRGRCRSCAQRIGLRYPAGMGMGDVKLALLLGAMLGRTVPVAMLVGMAAALVPGIYLLARHGSKGRKMGVPLAPFLALGSLVALFAGHPILHAYLHIGH